MPVQPQTRCSLQSQEGKVHEPKQLDHFRQILNDIKAGLVRH
jgi:hypothetical protein